MHKISLCTAIAYLKSAKALRVDFDVIPHFFPRDFDDVFMFVTPLMICIVLGLRSPETVRSLFSQRTL